MIELYNIFEQLAKEDFLALKQEASDLQEYSNAKLDRVTRYLGVLAEKTRKLGEELSCISFYCPTKDFQAKNLYYAVNSKLCLTT